MIDSIFSSHNYQVSRDLLDVSILRHKVMAGNLANSETPGFQRMDLSPAFQQSLQQQIAAGQSINLLAQNPQITPEANLEPSRPDGNTVSLDRELMLINENALRYEALTQFVSSSLARLKTAISGRL